MARQGYRECIVYGISGLNKVLDKSSQSQEHTVWMQMEFLRI